MRIALDARKAHDTGIGRYIRCLTAAMVAVDPSLELLLLMPPDLPAWLESRRVHRVDFTAGLYSVGELWRAAGVVGRQGPDLFHEPHYVLPFRIPCPTVVTIHDLIHWRFPEHLPNPVARRYARWMIGSATGRADRVLTVSTHSRDDLVRLVGVPPDRVTVTPLGVEPDFYSPDPVLVAETRAELDLTGEYVLYVGALKAHKNPGGLVRAFGEAALPDATLVMVGGAPGGDLRAVVRERGLEDRVRFVGPQSEDRLRGLYGGARVFAFPSRYEGFGLPLLEAMAAGVPAIASRAASLPEVGGDGAEYVPPDDDAALAGALRRLWTDPGARDRARARGLARARELTWEATARLTLDAYRRTLGTSSGP